MQSKSLIFTSLIILFAACSTPKSALDNASSGNEPIPVSFNPSKTTLLIEQTIDDDKSNVDLSPSTTVKTDNYMNYFMKKNKKNMIEYADKNYAEKHEFASQSEIYGSENKYSDKQTYRFALVTSLVKPTQSTTMNANTGQLQSSHHQPIFKFYLYDRLNDKTYAALGHGSSLIMWAFKDAIKKIAGTN